MSIIQGGKAWEEHQRNMEYARDDADHANRMMGWLMLAGLLLMFCIGVAATIVACLPDAQFKISQWTKAHTATVRVGP